MNSKVIKFIKCNISHPILSNIMIISVMNLDFHCTEVHRTCNDAVVARSNVLRHWECKKSISIFPTNKILKT